MKDVILVKENGKVKIIKNTKGAVASLKLPNRHMCWEYCENASANKCEKIKDLPKKYINEYPFISDGYQVIDNNGNVASFTVSSCNNYQKVKEREKTAEEKARIRKIKEGLRIAYFETLTLDEAYLKQAELYARGEIKNIRGKKPNDKEIALIKRRIKRTDK